MKKILITLISMFLLQTVMFATDGDLRDDYFSATFKNLLIIKNSAKTGLDTDLDEWITDGFGNKSPLKLSTTDFQLGDTAYEPDAKLFIRSANVYLNAPSDGKLLLYGSSEIEVNTPTFTISAATNITGATAITGNTSVTGTFGVSDVTTFSGNVLIGTNYISYGGVASEGISIANGGNVSLSHALTVGTTSTLGGNTDITGTLGVSGITTLADNLLIGANYLSNDGGSEGISIDATGNVTTSGSLTVGAGISATSGVTAAALSISTTSNLTGDITCGGNITMTNGYELDLDGNNLWIDADKDTKIFPPADDIIGINLGGSGFLTLASTVITPAADNTIDLGIDGTKDFKDGFFQGALKSATLTTTGAVTAGSNVTVGANITIGANITTSEACEWRLKDNTPATLKIGSVGATDILEICSTDGIEFVEFNATVVHQDNIKMEDNIIYLSGVGATGEKISATSDEIYFGIDNVNQIIIKDGAVYPVTDDDINLGIVTTNEFKDAFFDGTVNCDAFSNSGTSTQQGLAEFSGAIGLSGSVLYLDGATGGTGEEVFATGNEIIFAINDVNQIKITDGTVEPITNNDIDLGVVTTGQYKNAYLSGIVYSGGLTLTDDATIGNDVDVTGDVKVAGLSALDGTPQSLNGAGAINSTTSVTKFTSTGVADALTIANGTIEGQIKYVYMIVDGGSGLLAGANFIGTSLSFDDDGSGATLMWDRANSKWYCVGQNGCTFAP